MTLNEISYNLLELNKAGKATSDSMPTLSQIKFMIRYYRALLVRRDINRNTFKTETLKQPLGCLELESVDIAECCEIALGCNILRTIKTIPEPIRLTDGDALWVFSLDGRSVINPINFDMVKYIAGNKFTYNSVYWFRRNGRIYLVSGGDRVNTIKYIRPFIIAADPIKASRLMECDENPCITDSSEYPIPADMVQNITQSILSGEFKFMAGISEDNTNDSQDNK